MRINKELNPEELKKVLGTPIKSNDLPNKFKQFGKGSGEVDEDFLETVIGGPHKASDLPDWAYKDNGENDNFTIEDDGTIVRK